MTVYYGGIIPSKVFNEEEYQSYLKFASSYELENDVVTKETLDKMGDGLYSKLETRLIINAYNTYLRYR
jgi:hypothetical protein